jgi:NTP pyrophosphatase (non-canonical NTP hydrolase)
LRLIVATDSDTSIDTLKSAVRTFCEARDWDQFHGAKDLAIGISTEAAELLEHFRFQSDEQIQQLFNDPSSFKQIQDEVADVLIFLLRFAQRFEIDLSAAVSAKLAENEERYPVADARGSNQKAERVEP